MRGALVGRLLFWDLVCVILIILRIILSVDFRVPAFPHILVSGLVVSELAVGSLV